MKVYDRNGNLKQIAIRVPPLPTLAPIDAPYLTWMTNDPTLINDRILTPGEGLGFQYGIPGNTFTISSLGFWKRLATAIASNSASIEFTDLSSDYIAYKIIVTNYQPATDNAGLRLRTSGNNGSSYDSGSGNYRHVGALTGLTGSGSNMEVVLNGLESDTLITVSTQNGNAANETGSGEITIINPSAAQFTCVMSAILQRNGSGQTVMSDRKGFRNAAAAVDAVQLFMTSGNIASGQFDLYGLRS